MVKVFLSSTFVDLIPEREAVQDAINRLSFSFVGMEHFGSFPEAPVKRSLRLLQTADVVVLLLGYQKGSFVQGSNMTFVDAEYKAASTANMPILAYAKDPEYYSRPPEYDAALSSLLEELKQRLGLSFFRSPHDLAWKVCCDLAREVSILKTIEPVREPDEVARSIFKKLIDERELLVRALEFRAERVVKFLCQANRFGHLTPYISSFKSLHQQHMQLLREGKLLEAHEVVTKIRCQLGRIEESNLRLDSSKATNYLRYTNLTPTRIVAFIGREYLNVAVSNTHLWSPYTTLLIYESAIESEGNREAANDRRSFR
jgi:hypothetical protein